MGINPKIGITGLPRSGKSAVLDKVVKMIAEEGSDSSGIPVIAGMRSEAIAVSYTHLTLPTKA